MVILFAIITLVLVLGLVATQLKLRMVEETCQAEKVRNDAQRAQFDRDTLNLRTECEGHTGASEARADRWKSLYRHGLELASSPASEGWPHMAVLFASAGHFRVAAIRVRDEDSGSFMLEHLVGLSEDVAIRLRETRVPQPMLAEWMNPRNAFGSGFVLRAKGLPAGAVNSPGGALEPQDAWLIPLLDAEHQVCAYVSLAQPNPCRLPDSDELAFYDAARIFCQSIFELQLREVNLSLRTREQLRTTQMEAASLSAYGDTLRNISERLRTGLGHIEGYAQTILEYGREMPWDEEKRLAQVAVDECGEILEDALLVGDMADITDRDGGAEVEAVEFSILFAESLQFLGKRAENKGVTLNGPPLQGGLYLHQPSGALKRLLVLVSDELIAGCARGNEVSLSAWQDSDEVHIHWRASGPGMESSDEEVRSPRWHAAKAVALALGGALRESTLGSDNRAVTLAIPLSRKDSGPHLRAA